MAAQRTVCVRAPHSSRRAEKRALCAVSRGARDAGSTHRTNICERGRRELLSPAWTPGRQPQTRMRARRDVFRGTGARRWRRLQTLVSAAITGTERKRHLLRCSEARRSGTDTLERASGWTLQTRIRGKGRQCPSHGPEGSRPVCHGRAELAMQSCRALDRECQRRAPMGDTREEPRTANGTRAPWTTRRDVERADSPLAATGGKVLGDEINGRPDGAQGMTYQRFDHV